MVNSLLICVIYIETLGVNRDATNEDIERAYQRLKMYFDPEKNNDPNIKIFFDDLTL